MQQTCYDSDALYCAYWETGSTQIHALIIETYKRQTCAKTLNFLIAKYVPVIFHLFFCKTIARKLTLICLRYPALQRWHLSWREVTPPSPPRHAPLQQAGARHFCSTR